MCIRDRANSAAKSQAETQANEQASAQAEAQANAQMKEKVASALAAAGITGEEAGQVMANLGVIDVNVSTNLQIDVSGSLASDEGTLNQICLLYTSGA